MIDFTGADQKAEAFKIEIIAFSSSARILIAHETLDLMRYIEYDTTSFTLVKQFELVASNYKNTYGLIASSLSSIYFPYVTSNSS